LRDIQKKKVMKILISRTNLRVSFFGGATDFKGFYSKYGGAVLSTPINKYIYIAVHHNFEKKIILKYSKTEICTKVSEIQNQYIKECFLEVKPKNPYLEIASFSDIPSSGGTGLGSSSAFTVGLLKALYKSDGKDVSNEELAKKACEIEIDRLKNPIGIQDQWGTAVGGLKIIEFCKDDSVKIHQLIDEVGEDTINRLQENLMLFYTGGTRDANVILSEQKKKMKDNYKTLKLMAKQVYSAQQYLIDGDIDKIGLLLDQAWKFKKRLASGISNPIIDNYYKIAKMNGALGGKILGAGSSGFLMVYVKPENQNKVRKALGLREMKFRFEQEGSKIIYGD
jgi:D-glycero-alpha-D-manno-heptose-7-phosphate kinase